MKGSRINLSAEFVLVYQNIESSLILFNFCSKTFKVNHVWSMESRSVSASPFLKKNSSGGVVGEEAEV